MSKERAAKDDLSRRELIPSVDSAARGGPGDLPAFAVMGSDGRRMKELGTSALLALMAIVTAFPPSHYYRFAWLTIPLMILASAHFGRRATDTGPRIEVDHNGITERTSIFGGTLHLAWEDVLSVKPDRWLNAVTIEVRDLSAVRASVGLGRRVELLVNRVFGKRTISIDLTLLGISKQELSAQIDAALLSAERQQLGFGPEVRQLPKGEGP